MQIKVSGGGGPQFFSCPGEHNHGNRPSQCEEYCRKISGYCGDPGGGSLSDQCAFVYGRKGWVNSIEEAEELYRIFQERGI